MRRFLSAVAVFSLLALLTMTLGCNDRPEQEAFQSNDFSSDSGNDLKAEHKASSAVSANETNDPNDDQADTRSFKMTYGATIKGVPKGASVRVWFPIAESNGQQDVTRGDTATPGDLSVQRDAKYGNAIGYFESTGKQEIAFEVNYKIDRKRAALDASKKTLDKDAAKIFLTANRLVPTAGRPLDLLAEKSVPKDPAKAGELLYELVDQHMKYDKSKPGYGNGDSVWACDSKTGNCTDFHSLFISLARSQDIPARFEIGFPIPAESKGEIGGYHCWAWFHVSGQGWLPVDISEADKHPEMKSFYFGNLTADRVSFSTGRDIELVPASKSEAQNYFVYPHVEVNGQKWPKDKIQLNFTYADQK